MESKLTKLAKCNLASSLSSVLKLKNMKIEVRADFGCLISGVIPAWLH
jgi:hypothetical protein